MRIASMAFVGTALAASVLAAACGSSNGSSPSSDAGAAETSVTEDTGVTPPNDAGPSTDAKEEEAAGYPAFVPTDVPQVANASGPVMKSPKIVPIFYAADDAATVTSIKDFLSKLPMSAYWSAWATEYGVGDVTIAAPVMLPDTLPATYDDTQIQAYLAGKLNAADPAFPAADANTIYAFFFPPNVTITTGGGATPTGDGGTDAGSPGDGGAGGGGVASSCTSFGGYHDNITLTNSMDVSYAVVPRCASFGPTITGLDAITGPASHELAEAATDPFPTTNPAYSTVDATHSYWSRLIGGGEVGDMCEDGDTFTKALTSLPYTVQRIWSNKAAKAGTDPCLPVPAGLTYFNTIPNMPDVLTISGRGTTVNPKGVEIPVGASKTIELDLFSTAPTSGPWTVKILDLGYLQSTAATPANTYLGITFQECPGQATCQGQNGDKLHMTIKVLQAGRRNYEPFFIESKLASGHYNLWAGIVGSSPDGG